MSVWSDETLDECPGIEELRSLDAVAANLSCLAGQLYAACNRVRDITEKLHKKGMDNADALRALRECGIAPEPRVKMEKANAKEN